MPAGRPTAHGRITKDDIKNARLRRWDGRKRITTDWINLYHEPELCFPNGDCFVYLREPGQSSRGPSFRVHVAQLRVKGFGALLDNCSQQVQMSHEKPECLTNGCKGCGKPSTMRALYLPSPRNVDLETIIDHHLSIRNFFAWLYNIPMAGRTLGKSLAELKDRLDEYRPEQEEQNTSDIVKFADFQRYLDFRECVDHALAAAHFAEKCHIDNLWIDAFAHCVGMGHRGLRASLEYPILSRASKSMISKARLEVDVRSDRVSRSVANFFENDLSAAFLGLHQAARDHLDRFRSFLQSFYIEQHGFWPPQDFDEEETKKTLYVELYSDFRNLYHHLVDKNSTSSMVDNVSHSGGVCTLQNIQAFDSRHSYDALPHPLPRLPTQPALPTSKSASKLSSLNLSKKRRELQEARDELSMQALIDSSDRDWSIMACLLVRRYSEFERMSVLDDFEKVSLVDGRKVRWILIYAVLQTLITVMQAPTQVRNTEGLSYSLCCHTPKTMPWNMGSTSSIDTQSLASSRASEVSPKETAPLKDIKVELTPDINYSHTNSSSTSLYQAPSRSRAERRKSLPLLSTTNPTTTTRTTTTVAHKPSSATRSNSLRRLLVKRHTYTDESPLPPMPTLSRGTTVIATKSPVFCEILVQGYGNGLNDAIVTNARANTASLSASPSTIMPNATSSTVSPISPTSPTSPTDDSQDAVIVSRESSTASASSAYTTRSSSTDQHSGSDSSSGSGTDDGLPEMDHNSVVGSRRASTATDKSMKRASMAGSVRRARLGVTPPSDNTGIADKQWVVDHPEVHFDTRTWDAFLKA